VARHERIHTDLQRHGRMVATLDCQPIVIVVGVVGAACGVHCGTRVNVPESCDAAFAFAQCPPFNTQSRHTIRRPGLRAVRRRDDTFDVQLQRAARAQAFVALAGACTCFRLAAARRGLVETVRIGIRAALTAGVVK